MMKNNMEDSRILENNVEVSRTLKNNIEVSRILKNNKEATGYSTKKIELSNRKILMFLDPSSHMN
jgi:hypothetical protein